MFRLIHEQGIARLALDRPEARNAIPASGWAELTRILDGVARSDARLLILSGEGGAFCAGADLSDFAAFRNDPPARGRFRKEMRAALDGIGALPMPTLALIGGACYGAGVALAMACDIRLAAPGAHFAITPAKIGISYPQQDIHRLVQLVGPGQAARLLFSASAIDGAEAARIGLVELHDADPDPLIAAILACDPGSLKALKRGLALAAQGISEDADADAGFDAMLGGDELPRRLEALRRK